MTSVHVSQITSGTLRQNCYLVRSPSGDAVLIDPGEDAQAILAEIRANEVELKAILNTHCHYDHIASVVAVQEALKVPFYANPADEDPLRQANTYRHVFSDGPPIRIPTIDHAIRGGEKLTFGTLEIQVLAAPGHTPGGISFLISDCLFSGDTLFATTVGRTDLPGSSPESLAESLRQLTKLDPGLVLHPGHGRSSTLGEALETPAVKELLGDCHPRTHRSETGEGREMNSKLLVERLSAGDTNADAVVRRGEMWSYADLHEAVERWRGLLDESGLLPGAAVALECDFSPESIAAFLALAERACIAVPITVEDAGTRAKFREIAKCAWVIRPGIEAGAGGLSVEPVSHDGSHPLYDEIRKRGHAGLVLFSSGTLGEPKAAVHDLESILAKFGRRGRRLRTVAYLLFDHIGGINTLLYTLCNAGCLILVHDRSTDQVLSDMEEFGAELLPTSPSFLKQLLMSGALEDRDLTALKTVSYGTEAMPESVLAALHEALPNVELKQTYGLSEVGILRSRSRSSNSLWVRVGGDEFQTRIRGGMLEIKADSAMLGYLNAPSPFLEDGWFPTGDHVEQDGDYIRFLGREGDLINVGGLKVFPAKVEECLRRAEGVEDAQVLGESSGLFGQMVTARVVPTASVDDVAALERDLKAWCAEHLEHFEVPTRIEIATEIPQGRRLKRGAAIRRVPSTEPRSGRPVLFVYSGQGPRWPGTGLELFALDPVFRRALIQCDDTFKRLGGWSLIGEIHRPNNERLDDTDIAQPAHFAYQYGLTNWLASRGVTPSAVVGHSMGEVAAAWASGALCFEDAARVIFERGRLTHETVDQGRMVWVDSPAAEVRVLLRELGLEADIDITAINEPDTSVVAGRNDLLEDLMETLRSKDIGNRDLRFRYGFHSPLMDPYMEEMETALSEVRVAAPSVPMFSTVTGEMVEGESLDAGYWARNMRNTVQFAQAVAMAAGEGHRLLIQLGPHDLLSGSIQQCLQAGGFSADLVPTLLYGERDLHQLAGALSKLQDLRVPGLRPRASDLVIQALDSLNEGFLRESPIEVHLDLPLTGRNQAISSLALLHLVVALEDSVSRAFRRRVSLSNDDVVTGRVRPFRTALTLAEYLGDLLGEPSGIEKLGGGEPAEEAAAAEPVHRSGQDVDTGAISESVLLAEGLTYHRSVVLRCWVIASLAVGLNALLLPLAVTLPGSLLATVAVADLAVSAIAIRLLAGLLCALGSSARTLNAGSQLLGPEADGTTSWLHGGPSGLLLAIGSMALPWGFVLAQQSLVLGSILALAFGVNLWDAAQLPRRHAARGTDRHERSNWRPPP